MGIYTKWFLSLALAMAVGMSLGYWLMPVKTVVRTVTRTERETVTHRDVTVQRKESTDAKGNPVIIETTVDHSRVETQASRTSDTSKAQTSGKTRPDWAFTVGVGSERFAFQAPIYFFETQRRILGEIWLGVWATTSLEGGISASVRF